MGVHSGLRVHHGAVTRAQRRLHRRGLEAAEGFSGRDVRHTNSGKEKSRYRAGETRQGEGPWDGTVQSSPRQGTSRRGRLREAVVYKVYQFDNKGQTLLPYKSERSPALRASKSRRRPVSNRPSRPRFLRLYHHSSSRRNLITSRRHFTSDCFITAISIANFPLHSCSASAHRLPSPLHREDFVSSRHPAEIRPQ